MSSVNNGNAVIGTLTAGALVSSSTLMTTGIKYERGTAFDSTPLLSVIGLSAARTFLLGVTAAPALSIALPTKIGGMILSLVSTIDRNGVSWVSTGMVGNLPTTIKANVPLNIIYMTLTDSWYVV
jgi:hypothetical protein